MIERKNPSQVRLVCALAVSLFVVALASAPLRYRVLGFWLTVFTLPGCLAVAICYARRTVQAFLVGAVFPATTPLIGFVNDLFQIDAGFLGIPPATFARIFSYVAENKPDRLRGLLSAWAASVVTGCIVAIVYRCFVSRGANELR